jgi:Secretion system C-terminal sorting domain
MKNSIILLCFFVYGNCFAQKEDYYLLSGYEGIYHGQAPDFGLTQYRFNVNSVTTSYISGNTNIARSFSSISTPQGRLLFYSNGIQVLDSTHQIMENGDSINIGSPLVDYNGGYLYNNGVLIVPRPNTTQYYLFQSFVGEIPYPNLQYYVQLKVSVIDMALNNGKGRVIEKNILLDNTWLNSCFLSATRHANGRDWWVVTQNFQRNTYYKYLITPQGISTRTAQTTRQPQWYDQNGSNSQSIFSPDGTKLAFGDLTDGATIFDFDRCSGNLSNERIVPIDSFAGYAGVAFSPNSRNLYIVRTGYILQVDTEASDILASVDTVAHYDGFYYDVGISRIYTPFYLPYNTPNGRIFIGSWNGNRYLHTIENPNEAGIACNVQQHSIFLPTWNNGTTPNFPTYRVGTLVGSGCDTIVGTNNVITEKIKVEIFPNPVNNNTRLIWYEPFKSNIKIEIINSIGQIIETIKAENSTTYKEIDTKNLPNGIYFIRLSTPENQTFTTKLIKISD